MTTTRSQIGATIARTPLFQGLPEAEVERLAATTRLRRLARNESIFGAGDTPTSVFVIVSGMVKQSCFAANGREKILELFAPPGSFGEAFLFSGLAYPCHATTLAETALVQIDRKPLMAVAASHPAIFRRIAEAISGQALGLLDEVEKLATQRSMRRVAAWLVEQCGDGDDGAVTLQTSKRAIALRLGMGPEYFSRMLRELSNAGLIAVEGRRVRMEDPARLRSVAA